jgi:hypothetical protein
LKPRRRRYFYRRRNRLRIKLRPIRARLGPYFQTFGWERVYAAIIKLHKQTSFVARRRPLLKQSLTKDEVFYLPYSTPATTLTFQLTPRKMKQNSSEKQRKVGPKGWLQKRSKILVRQPNRLTLKKQARPKPRLLKAWLIGKVLNEAINRQPGKFIHKFSKLKMAVGVDQFCRFMAMVNLSRAFKPNRQKLNMTLRKVTDKKQRAVLLKLEKARRFFVRHYSKIPALLFKQHLVSLQRRFTHVLQTKYVKRKFKSACRHLQARFKLRFYKKPWIAKWLQYYTTAGNNPKMYTLFKRVIVSLKYMHFFANLFVINKLFNLTFRAKLAFKLKRLWSRGSLQEYASTFKKLKSSPKPYV